MTDKELSPIGRSWDEVETKIFTPEELAASDARVAIMLELIEARQKRGITQQRLEQLSGVRQPIIARMETGVTSPQLDTVLKVLAPLGKTLYVGDIKLRQSADEVPVKPKQNKLSINSNVVKARKLRTKD
jgi:predicted transcriptional regulator